MLVAQCVVFLAAAAEHVPRNGSCLNIQNANACSAVAIETVAGDVPCVSGWDIKPVRTVPLNAVCSKHHGRAPVFASEAVHAVAGKLVVGDKPVPTIDANAAAGVALHYAVADYKKPYSQKVNPVPGKRRYFAVVYHYGILLLAIFFVVVQKDSMDFLLGSLFTDYVKPLQMDTERSGYIQHAIGFIAVQHEHRAGIPTVAPLRLGHHCSVLRHFQIVAKIFSGRKVYASLHFACGVQCLLYRLAVRSHTVSLGSEIFYVEH